MPWIRSTSRLPRTDRRILNLLKGKPWGLRTSAIASKLAVSPWTVYDAVARLHNEGRVVRGDRTWGARYTLPGHERGAQPSAPVSDRPFLVFSERP